MKIAPNPKNEAERIKSLLEYQILDSLPEQDFDELAFIASYICQTPVALISLLDSNRQWFKSKVGIDSLETSRELAFCSHTILEETSLVVPDTLEDERFHDNPLTTASPGFRFYAGAPLITPNGSKIGSLCVIDYKPRVMNSEQIKALEALSRQVINQLELRRTINQLHHSRDQLFRAKEEAERALSVKARFLANMSHEIRTPMNGIVGMCKLLLDTPLSPVQVKNLKIIQNCGNSLLELVNDILDFSKLEACKFEQRLVTFPLRQTIRELFHLFDPKVQNKRLKLDVAYDASIPEWISADKTHFLQILSNLIGNAIKFTDQGSVTLSVSSEKLTDDRSKLTFCVKDSGTGIPPEGLKELFKAFSQVDASSTRKFGGTGLGLAISKGLCEAMGGEIWVDSKLGEGSSFYFTLLAQEVIAPASDVKAEKKKTTEANQNFSTDYPLSILIAEDDYVNQLVITGYLKSLGYKPSLVSNGLEVLETLKNNRFDVVLMDCQMPQMDGFQTTQEIILRMKDSRPRIVAVTASAMEDDADHCRKCGMDDVLTKPVSFDLLKNTLQNIKKETKASFPPLSEPKTLSSDVFDEKKFWSRFRGLESVGTSVLNEFLNHAPRMLTEISEAIHTKNGRALELSAHTFRGALSNVSSNSHHLAATLEMNGKIGDFSNVKSVFDSLSSQVQILCQVLKESLPKAQMP